MKLFEKNGHAIIWGDTIDALINQIPDGSIDLVFADPPYNIGKNFNGRKDRWPSDEAIYLGPTSGLNYASRNSSPAVAFT